ncbi:hypothetical protein BDD12DRAFT_816960 [Trichophaea hybrida]|nr:hypothetical protein BDD12DRAFT_816960 [Trichophaea hybrida]
MDFLGLSTSDRTLSLPPPTLCVSRWAFPSAHLYFLVAVLSPSNCAKKSSHKKKEHYSIPQYMTPSDIMLREYRFPCYSPAIIGDLHPLPPAIAPNPNSRANRNTTEPILSQRWPRRWECLILSRHEFDIRHCLSPPFLSDLRSRRIVATNFEGVQIVYPTSFPGVEEIS